MTAASTLEDWIEDNNGTGRNYGKTAYVARITGLDDEYRFEREFVNETIDTSYSGKTGRDAVPLEEIVVGAFYELRYDSWKHKHQTFVRVDAVERDEDGHVHVDTTELTADAVELEFGGIRGVEGVGRDTAAALRDAGFDTLDDVEEVEVDDLTAVAGVGPVTAENILLTAH